MTDVEPLDEPFERPADLDPVAMLEHQLAVGWDYAVEVLVAAPVDRVRRYLSPALGRHEPVERQVTRLAGSTSNPRLVCRAARRAARSVPRRGQP